MITCSALEEPENGFIMYGVDTEAPFDLGTMATYVCNDGFGLMDVNSTRFCTGDDSTVVGEWSGSASRCEGI